MASSTLWLVSIRAARFTGSGTSEVYGPSVGGPGVYRGAERRAGIDFVTTVPLPFVR
jgi:hypothetical protein